MFQIPRSEMDLKLSTSANAFNTSLKQQSSTVNSVLFVIDATSTIRFEAKREIILHSVILQILQQYKRIGIFSYL